MSNKTFVIAGATGNTGRIIAQTLLADQQAMIEANVTPWVQFPYEDAKGAMQGMGFSESVAQAFVDFAKRANDLSIWGDVTITEANRAPTTIEQFVDQFTAVYNN